MFEKLRPRPGTFLHDSRHVISSLPKNVRVKLDFFTDPDMHLFVENNIRGGVSVVTNRYAKANNSYTEDGVDETESPSYICYLDANNLYGYAMSQPLPTSNFRS